MRAFILIALVAAASATYQYPLGGRWNYRGGRFLGSYGTEGTFGPYGVEGTFGPYGKEGFFGRYGVEGTFGPYGKEGFFGPYGVEGTFGPFGTEGTYGPRRFTVETIHEVKHLVKKNILELQNFGRTTNGVAFRKIEHMTEQLMNKVDETIQDITTIFHQTQDVTVVEQELEKVFTKLRMDLHEFMSDAKLVSAQITVPEKHEFYRHIVNKIFHKLTVVLPHLAKQFGTFNTNDFFYGFGGRTIV